MPAPPIIHSLNAREYQDLQTAKSLLENPRFAIRLAAKAGKPLEKGLGLLPKKSVQLINYAAEKALFLALKVSIASLGKPVIAKSHPRTHKLMAAASGGLGGIFGLAALPVELPVSTGIMLRSIAEIARSEGHDLSTIETRLNCLEVFALGGTSTADNEAKSAYWLTRSSLAKTITETLTYLTQKEALDVGAPVLVRFVNGIAGRFGLLLSEEVAAKAIPLIGAAAGSAINVIFLSHFQQMARGHFIIKRLEAAHGIEKIQQLYEDLPLK